MSQSSKKSCRNCIHNKVSKCQKLEENILIMVATNYEMTNIRKCLVLKDKALDNFYCKFFKEKSEEND